MNRISIDVTASEHQRLKALAALQGQSIKDFVLSRTLGENSADANNALMELESLLRRRLQHAESGAVSKKTISQIFDDTTKRKPRD